MEGGWIAPAGPDLDAFEADIGRMTGWPGAVALSSGTAALHLALLVLGVAPEDEVVVSTFTFAASANAVVYCGAKPVLVDSDPTSWNLSPQLLADQLAEGRRRNRLPKAVVVVDLYGQCADYDEIVPQCEELGIPVIEDAAEALGSSYKGRPAGALGTVGVLSFNGNKIATTSGGGMFLSPGDELAERVRYLATQARRPAVHYEHTDVGFNYRLSNLLAALGRAQVERLPSMSARRRAINDRYRAELAACEGLSFMPVPEWSGWNGWLSCLVFDDASKRDLVREALEADDIESRPLWKPMHLQPVFAGIEARVDGTSEELFRRGLCLPSGSALTDDDLDRIIAVVVGAVTSRP
jgi:dTDP-4-amino-4,6-dideoxygalactose transaminase